MKQKVLKPCVDPHWKQKFIFTCAPLTSHLSEKIFLWKYLCVCERACARVCRYHAGKLRSARAGCALNTKSSLQLLYFIHFQHRKNALSVCYTHHPRIFPGYVQKRFCGWTLNSPRKNTQFRGAVCAAGVGRLLALPLPTTSAGLGEPDWHGLVDCAFRETRAFKEPHYTSVIFSWGVVVWRQNLFDNSALLFL